MSIGAYEVVMCGEDEQSEALISPSHRNGFKPAPMCKDDNHGATEYWISESERPHPRAVRSSTNEPAHPRTPSPPKHRVTTCSQTVRRCQTHIGIHHRNNKGAPAHQNPDVAPRKARHAPFPRPPHPLRRRLQCIAHAFGYTPHEIIGIVFDRPVLAPNMAPANEALKEARIYNHNESPRPARAGVYLLLLHRAPATGGETTIPSSLELFRRARAEMPTSLTCWRRGHHEPGHVYGRAAVRGRVDDETGVRKEFADTDDDETKRRKVEAQIARYGRGRHTTSEWTDDDRERLQLVLTHHLPRVPSARNPERTFPLPTPFRASGVPQERDRSQEGKSRRAPGQERRASGVWRRHADSGGGPGGAGAHHGRDPRATSMAGGRRAGLRQCRCAAWAGAVGRGAGGSRCSG
ncbi:uncharacterized protein DSM5745_10447 [Aspergillus mulundensis]|uniref:TauD/TfdA-like domain-containing protein n=1 Tax=Aspergillus mulundensis TaxID=1810919 RepID=A0A3D8QIZ1_9EURO|nr:hypothetical protein DSM5745_10447 [Aspergillus mulundensis]RDW61775.1 hypothetical protein DSM5745_10447 [Aspergillus mulundensis]